MTISELKPGDVVGLMWTGGRWLFTGEHPYDDIMSLNLMVRVDVWPFVVGDFDDDAQVAARYEVVPEFSGVPMEGDSMVSDAKGASTVPGRIEAICEYLREHLYKKDPGCGLPGSMRLSFDTHTKGEDGSCELCTRSFGDGERVLEVEYDTTEISDLIAWVCLDLKACQERRGETDAAVMLEQQKIVEAVVLP